jgi:hypothetical protein
VDVVPYQVTIGEKWLRSAESHPEPRGRRRRAPRHVGFKLGRRPLTLLALGFGCLAFAATATAGIDDSLETAAADAASPSATSSAPVVADVPTPVETTTAAPEGAQTAVSPQYQDENAVVSAPGQSDVAPVQPDPAAVVDQAPESSSSADQQASEPAANPLLITHAASRPSSDAATESEPRAAQPAPSTSTAVTSPPVSNWYRNHNSQYQFDSSFKNTASDVSSALSHAATDQADAFAQDHIVEQHQIRLSVPASIVSVKADIGGALLSSISAQDLNQGALCPALSGGTSGCATAWQRYHGVDPRYRPGAGEREAVSNVLDTLGETAQQLAVRRTNVGRSPSPQPADVRPTTPVEAIPTASRSFVPGTRAAVTRTLSALTGLRPRELPPVAPALRIARGLGASLLPRLEALPRPRDLDARKLTGGHLADTRRLLQIGIGLGIAYLLFLTFWFWGTRGRHRGLRGTRF